MSWGDVTAIGAFSPVMAFVVVMTGMLGRMSLRWMQQRSESKHDEWTRMRELLGELLAQRAQQDRQVKLRDALIEEQAQLIAELRRNLRDALCQTEDRQETP